VALRALASSALPGSLFGLDDLAIDRLDGSFQGLHRIGDGVVGVVSRRRGATEWPVDLRAE